MQLDIGLLVSPKGSTYYLARDAADCVRNTGPALSDFKMCFHNKFKPRMCRQNFSILNITLSQIKHTHRPELALG